MVRRAWAVGVCSIACLLALGKQHGQLFTRVVRAPPASVAPLSHKDLAHGAKSEFLESWITSKRHNQLTWLPAERHLVNTQFSSILVLGDSYADDVDMGFFCWPSRLGKRLKLPVLNVARGGSESAHVSAQLERAHAWNHEDFALDIQSLLILHTGGNDALHSLRNPRMLALLISDLYSLRSSNEDKLELSFPRELGKAVTSRLDDFFASAAVHGHRHIVLSTLPIISCLPLARLLVQLLVPGANAGFVTRSLRALGRSINQSVCGDIQSLAAKHGVYAQVFDEASQLELLAEEAGASQLGLSDGLRLVLRQLQRILTGPVKDSGFWHDGHHPAAEAHERLAEEAEKNEKESSASPQRPEAATAVEKLRKPQNPKLVPSLNPGSEVRFVSTVARRLRILGAMMRGDRNSAHGAVNSLASFDMQNRYGRQALARFFELLRTGQQPEVSFSFLARRGRQTRAQWQSWPEFRKAAEKALDLIGLRPDTEDKYEESLSESKSLNIFLNRLLMLEPVLQNALFDAVAELYAHLVSLDQASGSYDGGPELLDKKRGIQAEVRLAKREVLFEDPVTGAETAYVRLKLDRGMAWDAAEEVLDRCGGRAEEVEGFYWFPGYTHRSSAPSVVLAVARPLLRGVRLGASGQSEDEEEENDVEFELHWPQGPPAGCDLEQRVYASTLRQGTRFRKAKASELGQVQSAWQAAWQLRNASERWQEEHVLTGSILSTWAVLGTAIGTVQSSKVRRIPLVRAKLTDGGAIVGVRVQPERIQEVRYLLSAISEQGGKSKESTKVEVELADEEHVEHIDVTRLSAQLEAFLRTQPDQRAVWHGWAGAHKMLVADGLVSARAPGMRLAQEAMEDLERNGKIDIDSETGIVHLREKPKGCGWYIPPPKKPKVARGRGRGRGGGRGRGTAQAP
ncbi:Sbno2 [Symbiodinium sp. CCMP2456]|nr:Sbno2 [Symbiodinium sp. CCMP2456]